MQINCSNFLGLLRLGYLHGSGTVNGHFLNIEVVSKVSLEGLRDLGLILYNLFIDLQAICAAHKFLLFCIV